MFYKTFAHSTNLQTNKQKTHVKQRPTPPFPVTFLNYRLSHDTLPPASSLCVQLNKSATGCYPKYHRSKGFSKPDVLQHSGLSVFKIQTGSKYATFYELLRFRFRCVQAQQAVSRLRRGVQWLCRPSAVVDFSAST